MSDGHQGHIFRTCTEYGDELASLRVFPIFRKARTGACIRLRFQGTAWCNTFCSLKITIDFKEVTSRRSPHVLLKMFWWTHEEQSRDFVALTKRIYEEGRYWNFTWNAFPYSEDVNLEVFVPCNEQFLCIRWYLEEIKWSIHLPVNVLGFIFFRCTTCGIKMISKSCLLIVLKSC